jgi:hypothetical protein
MRVRTEKGGNVLENTLRHLQLLPGADSGSQGQRPENKDGEKQYSVPWTFPQTCAIRQPFRFAAKCPHLRSEASDTVNRVASLTVHFPPSAKHILLMLSGVGFEGSRDQSSKRHFIKYDEVQKLAHAWFHLLKHLLK